MVGEKVRKEGEYTSGWIVLACTYVVGHLLISIFNLTLSMLSSHSLADFFFFSGELLS